MSQVRSASVNDPIQRVIAAAERMGYTHEARLGWVLNFVHRDLSMLRAGEWLDLQDDLFVFSLQIPPDGIKPSTLQRIRYPKKVGHKALRTVQSQLKKMMEALVVRHGYWAVPPTIGRYCLDRSTNGSITTGFIHEGSMGFTDTVVMAAINALTASQQRIRQCIECRRIFLAVRRQVYCAPVCSQKARTRRFLKAHPEQVGSASSPAQG